MGYMGLAQAAFPPPVAKTADYTLSRLDHGKVFTTRGATGAVTFTLPAIADIWEGWSAWFFNAADQNMAITAPANKLTAKNNLTATTITFSTATELIGAAVWIYFDGTTYLVFHMTEETVTATLS